MLPKEIILSFFLLISFFSCNDEKDYTTFVNVFTGTDFHGHTFPGAMVPHGMVQLSPDTRITTWDGCSGYHYSDKSIMGFSHTHFSGTGSGGGADILLMPTVGDIQISVGDTSDTKSGYRAAFSHDTEWAVPGYYGVELEDGIKAELTASMRVGFHKYTYGNVNEGNIIFDLVHGINDQIDSIYVKVLSDSKICGFRHVHGGLDGDKITYFVAEFSQPFTDFGLYHNQKLTGKKEAGGKNIKAHFSFSTTKEKVVMVKVAISRVDLEGAENNLRNEIPGWDFQGVRDDAQKAWNKVLSKIEVEGGTEKERRTFYTALYHCYVHPNISMDFDRRYRSTDHKVYQAEGFDNYTTFSLWDTFRALHPYYNIVEPSKSIHFIRTYLERYQHFGSLPIMEFGGNEGYSMIGYHSLPVIADAYVKNIRDYDTKLAFEAMKQLSEGYRVGKDIYKKMGFMPYDLEGQSVSRTLEYSYDDWCVSRLAKDFNEGDYRFYTQKGQFYKNLYCSETGFMRPRYSNYNWYILFDPMTISNAYTEANAYQYTTFVPHDINGLIRLMGGEEKFDNWLDVCFTTQTNHSETLLQDVTGLIGQYAHGNEPSHNMAYLYSFVGKPWKTQARVREIMDHLYSDQPDGVCGNEDAGQMSAWYVLSAMGFYPVTPGMDYYVFGTPLFEKMTIKLENGKQFVIKAANVKLENCYIQSVSLNGTPYSGSFIRHADITGGGELAFVMGDKPNMEFGLKEEDRPHTEEYKIAPMPMVKSGRYRFLDQTEVTLLCDDPSVEIRYTTDGSLPVESSKLYEKPFVITESVVIKTRGFAKGYDPSYTVTSEFEKLTLQQPVKVENIRPGLAFDYCEGYCVKTDDMSKYPVLLSSIIPTFDISAIKDDRAFGYHYKGYINVPVSGVYTFYVDVNDGAVLYIDGKMVVDNDGNHARQEKSNTTALAKGLHSVELKYFQMGGAKALVTSWEKPGGKKEEIPATALFH